MSSRKASMDVSRTYDMTDASTGKAVQVIEKAQERDNDQIENDPGMFSAEQTWPTQEEMDKAKKRANSGEMDMEMEQ